ASDGCSAHGVRGLRLGDTDGPKAALNWSSGDDGDPPYVDSELKLQKLSRRRRGRWNSRSRGHPDPLPTLAHAIDIEDVLAIRVDHLALDKDLLIGHRWLRHRRGIDLVRRISVARIGVVRIRVVGIGQRCA